MKVPAQVVMLVSSGLFVGTICFIGSRHLGPAVTPISPPLSQVSFASATANEHPRCEAIFQPPAFEKRSLARRRELGFHNQYLWSRVIEQRVGPIVNGEMDMLISRQFPLEADFGSTTAIVTGIRRRPVPADLKISAPPPETLRFWDQASASLDFVIDLYRERRPHWGPEFLNKLRAVAREYLHESTYITIERGTGYRSSKPLATIRLIREKNGFLPMEKYLGIEIDAGNKLKVEPGNLAVDKELNREVWPELLMQLLNASASEIEPGRENYYLTYADRYSLALYSQLGFKPVDLAKIKVGPGVVTKDGKILANDVWWTPMEATQAALDGLMDLHLERMKRRGADPDEIEILKLRQQELSNPAPIFRRETFGTGTKNGQTMPGRLEVSTVKDTIKLTLRSNDLQHVSILGVITPESLPLGSRPITLIGSGRAHYENGILVIERSNESYSTRIEIKTTPDLGVITALRMKHRSQAEGETNIAFDF